MRRRTELVERVVEVGCEPGEPVLHPALVGVVTSELELDPECHELLLHTVVEVTLDLPPFRRGRPHEPPLGRAQRVHRVEKIVLQPAVLERQQRRGPDDLHELRILAQRFVVHDRQNRRVAVSERAPGDVLGGRVQDGGGPVPVHEMPAARQPEDQPGLRIVEYAPNELLDGRDGRPTDQLASHECERLPRVGPREEQAGDEPQRKEDARACGDRQGRVTRR